MKESKDRTYLQCTNCGRIYSVEKEIELSKIYINSYCPHCEHERALNLGDDENDIYELYDNTLDSRFFIY